MSHDARALPVGQRFYFLCDRFTLAESHRGDALRIDGVKLFEPGGVASDCDDPRRAHGEGGEDRADASDASGAESRNRWSTQAASRVSNRCAAQAARSNNGIFLKQKKVASHRSGDMAQASKKGSLKFIYIDAVRRQ